ncbi:DUF5658 family protein [Radiobacillus sp. PE A8.2]|uniref:DUF5658 family protein n=1 Tax=Radiobacillus sp. PE A8.2 TaxID=3380349 RepID=UPI00388DB957
MMKLLFLILSILNAFDGLITYYGLEHSFIAEANPLMALVYNISPNLFLVSKLILSVMLITLAIKNMLPKTRVLHGLLAAALVVYSYTCFLHGVWMYQVI